MNDTIRNRNDVARAVMYIKRALDLSDEQLARYIGVTRREIARWKSAKNSPAMENLEKLRSLLTIAKNHSAT